MNKETFDACIYTKKGEIDDDVKFFQSLSNPEKLEVVTLISSNFDTAVMELLRMLHNQINSSTTRGSE